MILAYLVAAAIYFVIEVAFTIALDDRIELRHVAQAAVWAALWPVALLVLAAAVIRRGR